jgi:hypothetical protein
MGMAFREGSEAFEAKEFEYGKRLPVCSRLALKTIHPQPRKNPHRHCFVNLIKVSLGPAELGGYVELLLLRCLSFLNGWDAFIKSFNLGSSFFLSKPRTTDCRSSCLASISIFSFEFLSLARLIRLVSPAWAIGFKKIASRMTCSDSLT